MRTKPLLIVAALAIAGAAPAATVPTPESYFGHVMGADRKLLDWDRVVSYFQSLARSSGRIRVRELGRTTGGRPFIAAFIGAPQTLANLEHYRGLQARLADPRLTPEHSAGQIVTEGKAVVMITCSIHSTEPASTSSAVQLAYNLLTDDAPRTSFILANTILILVPSLNPDGVDIVTQWYRRTLDTPYEGSAPPELYQKYIGHDNNRDWYIFSQKETRIVVSELHNAWHPQIVYDVHQQGSYGSRIFVPPWLDPIDPNVDPVLVQEMNAFGSTMAADLTAAGKTGVAVHALYDFWSPARQYSAYHAGLRILSESASAKLASPLEISRGAIEAQDLGFSPRERSWNYLEPWLGGVWRIGDIVSYQIVAMESCLYQAALRREDLLHNFYEIGRRAIARTAPFAFVIPAGQRDPGATRKLIETLSFGGVEVETARGDFTAGGRRYPRASYVVRMQQPYSSFAKTLIERQHYPDLRLYPGGPPQRPYDVTAQTLPLLMGVDVDTIDSAFHADLARAPTAALEVDSDSLSASDTETWRKVTRIWNEGKPVWRDPETGDFLKAPLAGRKLPRIAPPRIGLYKSYVPALDEGWTRWLLDTFGFSYTSLTNRTLNDGDLNAHFDAIVFPDQSLSTITEGYRAGDMPAQYTGGLSAASALEQYVELGGTLIFLNRSAEYAIQRLGVKLHDAAASLSDRDFYSPGSLLNVTIDPHDPLAYGLPGSFAIWNERSPAWDVPEAADTHAVIRVIRYPSQDLLASGWLLGGQHIAGKTALVRIRRGKGQMVLFGMRPQYRAQSYLTFKLFFNALLLGAEAP